MEELGTDILEKTQKAKSRFDELTELVSKPEIIADNKEWKKLVKERSMLEELASAHDQLASLMSNYKSCQNDYEVEITSRVTGSTQNAIYSEAYKILKQNGNVISSELLSRDTYKRH